MESESMFLFDL